MAGEQALNAHPDLQNSGTGKQAPTAQDNILDSLAALNKAAADSLRLEVIRVLRNNSFGVLELCHILDVKQSALSHHLKILAQAGLVATRREGNSIFYRRQSQSEPVLQSQQQTLFACIDEAPLSTEIANRLQQVQHERAASSASFFQQNAKDFEQQQELIATHSLYGDGVKDLLSSSPLQHFTCALEVGPGRGEFLAELSSLFKQVIALDNSSEMLEYAAQSATQHQLNNIEFIHSDTAAAISQHIQADCIVMNMVLHHTPSPADIFHDLYQLANDDGVLLIAELCRHDQDWVKDACGDLWFGFEPEDLIEWASNAGFNQHQSVYHALRNGFQIQMHSFCKNPFHLNQTV